MEQLPCIGLLLRSNLIIGPCQNIYFDNGTLAVTRLFLFFELYHESCHILSYHVIFWAKPCKQNDLQYQQKDLQYKRKKTPQLWQLGAETVAQHVENLLKIIHRAVLLMRSTKAAVRALGDTLMNNGPLHPSAQLDVHNVMPSLAPAMPVVRMTSLLFLNRIFFRIVVFGWRNANIHVWS